MRPKIRAARGRFIISEEISREEVWERLTETLTGVDKYWLIPYIKFRPINTERLAANIKLEAEEQAGGRYPCELSVWDADNKRFVLKIMHNEPDYFTEYDFSVNHFMKGEKYVDLRLTTYKRSLVDRIVGGASETVEEQVRRTLSYIPVRGHISFVKAE
jgi:hypothetical protein